MKNTNIKILKNGVWSIILPAVFLVILLAVQYFICPDFGDDIIYAKVWAEKPLGTFLTERYHTWSSRLIIEAVMIPLATYPLIWRGLNIAMILLLVWITADLFGIKNQFQAQVLFFVMMWIVPFYSLYNAGWIATTVNYLWCMVLGLVAMRPIKHWVTKEKCSKWEYIICPLCMLYAANMELMGAILLGVYLIFGAYLVLEQKKLSPFYLIQVVLNTISLCFILTTPGNANRVLQETQRFFPEFANMGTVEKLMMGFLDACHYYISGGRDKTSYLFACLTGVLFVCYMTNDKRKGIAGKAIKNVRTLIVLCPLLAYWCFAHFFKFLLEDIHITRARNLFGIFNENRNIPGQSKFPDMLVYFQMLVYLFIIACVVLTLYFLHGKSKETLFQLLILAAGFCSKLVMGFSPTVYASEDRTALFCTMAILIVVLRNVQNWLQTKPKVGWKIIMGIYMSGMIICNIMCNIIK